jgi:beta-ketoacyl ACP synthase
VNRETIQAYWKVRALTDQNQLGAAACRPFDQDRAGFVMAEGAGLMVLESEQHAAARGAKVLAKVAGAGMVSEAYKIATPQLDGVGMARAMTAALENAKLPADAISHMSAHAPSTPQGDMAEALAVHRAFGKHAAKMSVTAPKSYIGHAIGASSAIQTALLALSVERGLQTPTLNLDQQDAAIDLDVVHGAPRPSQDEYAMVNAFGFGGHNVSLILGKA